MYNVSVTKEHFRTHNDMRIGERECNRCRQPIPEDYRPGVKNVSCEFCMPFIRKRNAKWNKNNKEYFKERRERIKEENENTSSL